MAPFIKRFLYGVLGFSLGLSVTGCATLTSVPPGLLYTNVRTPRAYRSATPQDVNAGPSDPHVTGQSCNRSLFYLVSWGDNGYAHAVQNATKQDPNAILYDVSIDARVRSFVLGLYTDNCTIIDGKLGHS